jgi:hypothetical protein
MHGCMRQLWRGFESGAVGHVPKKMFRRYWRNPHFWRWFWHDRVSLELKALTGVVAAVLILAVGWFAADRLSSASAETTSAGDPAFITVQKVVTLHSAGRVIRKLVPEVQRVVVTRTTMRTSVETVQGGVRTMQGKRVVVRIPGTAGKLTTVVGPTKTVTTKTVVTSKGGVTTDVQTRTSTLTRIRTETQVVTNPSTVTSTVARTVTNTVPTTRTVTQPVTVTTTQVVTVTQTTTSPPVTVTVTQPILTLTL